MCSSRSELEPSTARLWATKSSTRCLHRRLTCLVPGRAMSVYQAWFRPTLPPMNAVGSHHGHRSRTCLLVKTLHSAFGTVTIAAHPAEGAQPCPRCTGALAFAWILLLRFPAHLLHSPSAPFPPPGSTSCLTSVFRDACVPACVFK